VVDAPFPVLRDDPNAVRVADRAQALPPIDVAAFRRFVSAQENPAEAGLSLRSG
jgi:hypothetical protein